MSITRLLLVTATLGSVAFCQVPKADQAEFFEKNVRPVLAQKCQMCHNAKVKTSALDMSSAAAFMAGMIAIAPSAVMAADMENGAQVFAGNCAACHAGGNNVIQNEKVILISSAYSMRICQLSVYRITLTCQRILSNMPPIFFVVTDSPQRGP